MLERWTRAVLRYRLVTLAAWLALLGFGVDHYLEKTQLVQKHPVLTWFLG